MNIILRKQLLYRLIYYIYSLSIVIAYLEYYSRRRCIYKSEAKGFNMATTLKRILHITSLQLILVILIE